MKKKLSGMTIGELKELIKDVDDSVEIDVWDNLGLVESLDLEIITWELTNVTTVEINIEGTYPSY